MREILQKKLCSDNQEVKQGLSRFSHGKQQLIVMKRSNFIEPLTF
jgi:hypothetical protein